MMKMKSPLPSARNSRVRLIRVGDIAVDMICTPGNARMRTAHSNGESLIGSISSFIETRQHCSRQKAARSFSGRSAVEKRTVEKPSGFISVALSTTADIGGITSHRVPGHVAKDELLDPQSGASRSKRMTQVRHLFR